MKVNRDTLKKIAHLARLEVKPAEEAQLLKDLSAILTWVEKLNEVDTEGVEPLSHVSQEINQMREDECSPALERNKALNLAPRHDNLFFKVPKVIKNK